MAEVARSSDTGRVDGEAGQRRTSTASTGGSTIASSTNQGKTTIEDAVVAKIAGLAAREIEGVHSIEPRNAGSAISGLASNLTSRMSGTDQNAPSQGGQNVNVEVGEREAAVDLSMTVDYGVNIPQVSDAVRRNIMNRVAAMTGLTVKEVNIDVTDLYFPQEQDTASSGRVQ